MKKLIMPTVSFVVVSFVMGSVIVFNTMGLGVAIHNGGTDTIEFSLVRAFIYTLISGYVYILAYQSFKYLIKSIKNYMLECKNNAL